MRNAIAKNLAGHLDEATVLILLDTYEQLVGRYRRGDLEGALTKAGRFVEHALRLIEGKRTGSVPPEIKSVSVTIRSLENDMSLPEPLRLLIPRVLYGMIYNLRSKRNAVHVKEIDPRNIDVAMAVGSASWVIAELLRMYHVSDETAVNQLMQALTRTSLPLIEAINGEVFVNRKVRPNIELLLLLANRAPLGMTRKELGMSAKCSQPSVTRGLQALEEDRLIHQASSNDYFITGSGEEYLARYLEANTTSS